MKKQIKFLSLLLIPALLLSACAGGGGNEEDDDTPKVFAEKTFLGEKTVGENTVKVYGSDTQSVSGYKTVAFEETNDLVADNEGMGWVILEEPLYGGLPSIGYKGVFPEVKTISLSTAWSCFELEPGAYDFTVMDETIDYWVGQGKTINMRLCTDHLTLNQGVVNGCPEWLFEEPYNVPKIVKDGDIYADLSDETYQTELRKFLNAFAGHYTAEDYPHREAIEVVELRGYGYVGEWHSGWNTYESVEDRVNTLREIIDIWQEEWGDTLLVVSGTYEFATNMWGVNRYEDYDEFMYDMAFDYAIQQGITFRRDGIGFALKEYDSRLAVDYFYLNTGLPLLGELGDGYALHGDDSAYPLFEALSEALHKWRVNYHTVVSWVAQGFYEVIEKEEPIIDYFNRLMGYRLVPDKVQYSSDVKAGDKLYLNTLWSNNAMGRAWKDYDLSVYLENAAGETVYTGTDAKFNPVCINGGEPHFFDLSYELPANLANGTYTLKFAVSDSEGNPKIRLPITGDDGDKKYYLGEVTVGNTAAKNLSEVNDLNGKESGFTLLGNGKLTNTLTTVDGTKAIVGEGTGIFAQGARLQNGKTYYISFDYKTNKNKDDMSVTDGSNYLVGAYDGGDGKWGDCYKWLDISNSVSHRSATITVPEDGKDYFLAFGGENDVAEIAIDNISVVKADTVEANFLINPTFTELGEDGEYRILNAYKPYWAEALQLRERLSSHATYMITFDAATTVDVSGGGFFYVMLKDSKVSMDAETNKYGSIESFSLNRIGSFWTPVEQGYRKYSYVFNTENYGDGWQLVFGVRNKGGVAIKNITLTRIDADYSYGSDPVEIEHNVVPDKKIDIDAAGGLVENFEAGAFNGGCMYPGPMSTGILAGKNYFNKDYVISGNYSCYIDNNNPLKGYYSYHVFCQTNTSEFCFSANTTYRVRFKFKIIRDAESNGSFFCMASGSGTAGLFEWKKGAYEVGKVYSVEYEFTTPNASDFRFLWGVRNSGAIAIDDVWFEKTESTNMTKPKVTEGHAYEVTQKVLYR